MWTYDQRIQSAQTHTHTHTILFNNFFGLTRVVHIVMRCLFYVFLLCAVMFSTCVFHRNICYTERNKTHQQTCQTEKEPACISSHNGNMRIIFAGLEISWKFHIIVVRGITVPYTIHDLSTYFCGKARTNNNSDDK